jgi:hypothetical protein
MHNNLMDMILAFCELQFELLTIFRNSFPLTKDYKWLSDAPKNGEVQLNGASWKFYKHGLGIRFSSQGIVIDVHDNVDEPLYIDWWRMQVFCESNANFPTKASINKCLEEINALGLLQKSNGGYLWRQKNAAAALPPGPP